jgi:hypothetical protein
MSQQPLPLPPLRPQQPSQQEQDTYDLGPPPLVPPPMPAQTLAYATPGMNMARGGYGVWRQGNRIVATREIDLGDACVKCGASCDGWRWNKTLYWHEPWIYVLILPGLLVYAICALILRKNARVAAGLCPAHRKRRNVGILLTWLLTIGGFGGFIGGMIVMSDDKTAGLGAGMFFGGIVLWIVAAVVASVMARVLVPKKIDEQYAWFAGADEAFLRTLPAIA